MHTHSITLHSNTWASRGQHRLGQVLLLATLLGGAVQVGHAQSLTVSSFSPAAGSAGSTITVQGANFATGSSGGMVTVTFAGGSSASAYASSYSTSISVTVPSGTQTGPISVRSTSGSSVTTSSSFTVLSKCVNAAAAVTPGGPITLASGGSQVLTAQATLPLFRTGFNGEILRVVQQPDDKLLVGGGYDTFNGEAGRILVRLNADGTRDNTFAQTGNGFNNSVQGIAVQADGKVVVGGFFANYNGVSRSGIARLNADGTLDNTFVVGTGLDGYAYTVAVQADGKILVGGNYYAYNGNVMHYLVRLNTNGSFDTTFNSGGIGVDGFVTALALQPDGKIVVGGNFSGYNGASAPAHVMRLNADGSLDTTFNPGGAGTNGIVQTLALQPDGKVLVGGSFTSYNGSTGAPDYLLRLNANGSLDTSFNLNGAGFNGEVRSVAVLSSGAVVAGGAFTSYNGSAAAPDGLVRLSATGALDNTFNAGGAGFGGNVNYGMAVQNSGKVVVAGTITSYNNANVIGRIARVNTDGTLDQTATAVPATYRWSPGSQTTSSITVTQAGTYSVQATTLGTNCVVQSNSVSVAAAPVVLVISSGTLANPTIIPAGTYDSIIIANGGVAQLGGNVVVNTAVNVQAGGALLTTCQSLTGAGTFTLAANATLGVCDPQGISTTPGQGAVQMTGALSLSTQATYLYNGTAPQVTGNALPATVLNLTTTSNSTLTLSQPLAVTQVVTIGGAGNLNLNGQPLLLPSTASGTALVVNSGTGLVTGGTATMQRYISIYTGGASYRQYSSPVQNDQLSTLATPGYTPDFSGGAAYNTSPTPGQVMPFPTVLTYDETRTVTAVNNYSDFDKGWRAAESDGPMVPGLGYSIYAPGSGLVDFTGALNSGAITKSNLTFSGPAGGWQLLGNPYPAPLNWSTMTSGTGQNLENMNSAVYVSESTGPYSGQYRTYLPALGQGEPLIPAGSGFFVSAATPGVAGTVRFTNANRATTWSTQPGFGRTTADLRPRVQLTLSTAANTLADDLTVYVDPAATTGIDAEYDAFKLLNGTGLNLSAVAPTGAEQAIVGLPALTAATLLPLHLQVPAAGTYQVAGTPANLPAGLTLYLRDLTTGQQQALSTTTSLTLTAGLNTRYALAFAQATALATTPGLTATQVAVFPNPVAGGAGVLVTLPVQAGQQATAEVRDALGRVVLTTRALTVRGDQATGVLPTAGLATGVYVLRLATGGTTVSKRLVVE